MKLQYVFHLIKPIVPRLVQLWTRGQIVRIKRKFLIKNWPFSDVATQNPPKHWAGWPKKKRFALVLTHDVETEKGQSRCRDLAKLEQALGFKSSFNFVPQRSQRYKDDPALRSFLVENGYEVGVHDLKHNGRLFQTQRNFFKSAPLINNYINQWQAKGFRAGSMYHNLEWISHLNIQYDASTFEYDPFEPQSDHMNTIFPFAVEASNGRKYIELPYTLPQDHTLFLLNKENSIALWVKKFEWIVKNNGMVLFITHPDYMNFDNSNKIFDEYPLKLYKDFLYFIKMKYQNQYWNPLPYEIAKFWLENYAVQTTKFC